MAMAMTGAEAGPCSPARCMFSSGTRPGRANALPKAPAQRGAQNRAAELRLSRRTGAASCDVFATTGDDSRRWDQRVRLTNSAKLLPSHCQIPNGSPHVRIPSVRSAVASDVAHETEGSSHDLQGVEEGLGIVESLKGRHIFLTGATGFLAKVLVEKILREQPDVGGLYLMIQPRGDQTAEDRLAGVKTSPLFERLRKEHGDGYDGFMDGKLHAVAGRLEEEGLGIDPAHAARLHGVVDVVINSAATTTFDERYDLAIRINTLGARGCLDFAKQCPNLRMLLHVSTAFVNGLRVGRTPERPFALGETIAAEVSGSSASSPALDVEAEIELALSSDRRFRAEAEAMGMSGADAGSFVNEKMREMGMERARMYGWQDTYVFTKAMGEMLVGSERAGLPVAICRPSIVESTVCEPMGGWMEGIRMADPIILAYGKGQIRGFVGAQDGVLDVVPCDYVINALLAMLAAHGRGRGGGEGCGAEEEGVDGGGEAAAAEEGDGGLSVYHVATSHQNPLMNAKFTAYVGRHFEKTPMKDRNGGDIAVGGMAVFNSPRMFEIDSWLRYQLPTKIGAARTALMEAVPALADPKAAREARKSGIIAQKTFEQLAYFAKIYAPYTFYKCRFDASNTMSLSGRLSAEERERFNFDLTTIDWEEYLVNVHIAGLRKYVLKGRS